MDIEVIIEGHEQRLKTLERDMSAMKEVQAEIRSMNETLVTLANELKHTNQHLARHEKKIDEFDDQIINLILERTSLAKDIITAKKILNKDLFKELDRAKAIELAIKKAKKGDLVLILGKGHEKTILRADGPHDFEDIKVARKILKNLN